MGNCIKFKATEFRPNEKVPGQDKVAYDILLRVFKQEDINKFWKAYCDLDMDNSGFIKGDEFRAYFKIEKTKFNEKLFGMFDTDGSGYLNFFEFACSLWNFLSTDPDDLGGFVFYLFDDDHTGTLEFKEIRKMVELIHATNIEKGGAKVDKLMAELSMMSSFITLDDFIKLTHRRPMLMNPVLKLQLKLQEDMLGEEFWKQAIAERALDPVKRDPGYIIRVSAHAVAMYHAITNKLAQEHKIKRMREEVDVKASSRNVDEKTRRRNSIVLGYMKMKDAVTAKPERKTVIFDSQKVRASEEQIEKETKYTEPIKKRNEKDNIMATLDVNAPVAVYVENIASSEDNNQNTKSNSKSKSKRDTIESNMNSAKSSPTESNHTTTEKKSRKNRATMIVPSENKSSMDTQLDASVEIKPRNHRQTMITPNSTSNGKNKDESTTAMEMKRKNNRHTILAPIKTQNHTKHSSSETKSP
jgi:Ca2+-binding EF-hand superfamily protein